MKKLFSLSAITFIGIAAVMAQGTTPAPNTTPVNKPTTMSKPKPTTTAKPKPGATTPAQAAGNESKPAPTTTTSKPKPGATTPPRAAGNAAKPAPATTVEKPKPVITQGPSIHFEKKEHDFGKLTMGPKASVVFTFTNNGTEPVVLSDVKASCGCTTPKWPTEPIAPGATANIEAVYDTNGRPGYFEKTITVTYSGKSEELKIKGVVDNQGSDRPGNGDIR